MDGTSPSRPSVTGRDFERSVKALFTLLVGSDTSADSISAEEFIRYMVEDIGFQYDDPRFKALFKRLKGSRSQPHRRLNLEEFINEIQFQAVLFQRAFRGDLIIPEFAKFRDKVYEIFAQCEKNTSGKLATYIPQLASVDPSLWAVSFTSIDGQRFSFGDSNVEFCAQSTMKPINYCIALEENGAEKVHQHIGREPSGHAFNDRSLSKGNIPHNPMINAGAIMACSLIRNKDPLYKRFDNVMKTWEKLAGNMKPSFNNSVYLSERDTADRNFCLGYMMREARAFPPNTDLTETLEFYFQCCSIELTTEKMSIVAATLANGGVNPLTGERIFNPNTVKNCLSLMSSCGMYDYSGEWAFLVGLPAKSGVSGAIFAVIPNVGGFCTYSPSLDGIGNSARGLEFFKKLVEVYSFHNFDTFEATQKINPTKRSSLSARENLLAGLYGASEGDLYEVQKMFSSGVCVDTGDYDGRTALHLAACGGFKDIVEYLLGLGASPYTRDRWGNTPIDDARRHQYFDIVSVLENHKP